MTREESYAGTQKIITHYEKKPRPEYGGTARGDDRKTGESRVEQNRRKREEAKMVSSERPDSRESIRKEKTRKEGAERDIRSKRDAVADAQSATEWNEKVSKKEAAQRKKEEKEERISRRKEQLDFEDERYRRQQTRSGNSSSPFATIAGGGMPSWMNMGGGLPGAMRAGPGRLPPAYTATALPPAFLFGGTSSKGTSWKGKRAASPPGTGLPSWFRY